MLSLGLASACLMTSSAIAQPHQPIPSKQDVAQAQQAVTSKQSEVGRIRAQLASANTRLQQASDTAEIAAEAYNGAQWKADQARTAADQAREAAKQAQAAQQAQRKAYAQSVVGDYQAAPELTSLAGMAKADGIDQIQQQTQAMNTSQTALNAQYGRLQAAASLAKVTSSQAADTERKAAAAEAEAKQKRDAAATAAQKAQDEAAGIAVQKTKLIRQLAHLKHVSVKIAAKRQAALEERAEERAAAAAAAKEAAEAAAKQAAAEAQAKAAQQRESQKGARTGTMPSAQAAPSASSHADQAPATSASGVSAALSFARAQIGEPYVWGAAGPSSWDCSGLVMRAWEQGGIDLPHYSVAQYEESTPISFGDLRPGDLVFWGTTENPGSIHHVALYAGNGMIIQAPHTGADVDEVSMYSWTAPNFFARP
ncbi:C40 family peptidase [Nocardioides sp. BP30]|uniref:C40 family peptidase n=1 Tax=Nocardioides sp. BP30 TaxID=3036374 RepID=UPI00246885A6|nr:C40 family peptidase [Nocardioides sp. BP30]WGL52863.1 C40 family peptidase [Nocardioides sp. BP30]